CRAVVDEFVVVAVAAPDMTRNGKLGDRPVHGAVGLDPYGGAAAIRLFHLRQRAAIGRARRAFGLMNDDVLPFAGVGEISPRRQPDDVEARNIRRSPGARGDLET